MVTLPFSGNPLDRAAGKRDEGSWLEAQRATARVYAFRDGKPLMHDGRLSTVHYRDPSIFLGIAPDGVAAFAVESDEEGSYEEVRAVALLLPPDEAAIVAVARSLFDWHRRNGFCAACGSATNVTAAGWKRICRSCGAEHFPRVDPVVIMLPTHGERCLLARQASWPAKRMAPLAGFIEPGESIEEACAREMFEEAGLTATNVRYIASQPWPFPSSLMMGLLAEVSAENAVADGVELEEVRWFSKEEAREVLLGTHPEVLPPNGYAIAHHLLSVWTQISR